jgi:hypothetical protein
VSRLGPNAYGEQLQPGRIADCYLGILLDQPLAELAPEPGRVLVVAPAALLHREIPQRDGQVRSCATCASGAWPPPATIRAHQQETAEAVACAR